MLLDCNLVCDYVRAHARYPDAALGTYGVDVVPRRADDGDGEQSRCTARGVASVRYKPAFFPKLAAVDGPLDLLAAVGTMFMQQQHFDRGVFDYGACPPQLARQMFFVDDVWLNGHMARKGVPRVRLGRESLSTTRDDAVFANIGAGGALWNVNRGGANNLAAVRAFAPELVGCNEARSRSLRPSGWPYCLTSASDAESGSSTRRRRSRRPRTRTSQPSPTASARPSRAARREG